jgi:endonuclease/exonuclease/phosphatase family protein
MSKEAQCEIVNSEVYERLLALRLQQILLGDFNWHASHRELQRISKLPGAIYALKSETDVHRGNIDHIFVKGVSVVGAGISHTRPRITLWFGPSWNIPHTGMGASLQDTAGPGAGSNALILPASERYKRDPKQNLRL